MAEYENREANYNNGLGKVVGSYAMACGKVDNEVKDAYVARQIELMSQEEPNAEFTARTTLVGMSQSLDTRISVPKIIPAPSKPFVIERAFLSLDMTVSAHSEDNLSVQSDTEVEGEAKVGFGMFSGSLRVKAAVSVAKESKRSSDYTSTTHAEITMVQGEAPEGLMKIIDALNLTVVRGLELNAVLIEDQAVQLLEEAQDSSETAEAA